MFRRISPISAFRASGCRRLRRGEPTRFRHRPGRDLLSRPRARPELRRRRARPHASSPPRRAAKRFPIFRAFWLERPPLGSNGIIVAYGVIDSEFESGAVRMTFRPGDMTIVDVETTPVPARQPRACRPRRHGLDLFLRPERPAQRDDIRPAVYESSGLQMLQRQGRMALAAAARIPRRCRSRPSSTSNPQGLRPPAARPRLTMLPGRRPAIRAASEPLDRADRRMGPGQRAAHRDPDAIPRSTTTFSPIGGPRPRWRPVPRSPFAYRQSGAGRRPSARRWRPSCRHARRARVRRAPSPLRRRLHRRNAGRRSPRTIKTRPDRRSRHVPERQDCGPIRSERPCASRSSLTPATKTRVRCGSSWKQAGNRSARHGSIVGRLDVPPDRRGPSTRPEPAMPPESRLEMPTQSLRRWSTCGGAGPSSTARSCRTPWLARLFVFGGAAAADRLRRLRDVPGRVGQPHHGRCSGCCSRCSPSISPGSRSPSPARCSASSRCSGGASAAARRCRQPCDAGPPS